MAPNLRRRKGRPKNETVGSTEKRTETLWVLEKRKMVCRPVTFVPGLYRIFDEILLVAAGNKQRDLSMNALQVEIDVEQNLISVAYTSRDGLPGDTLEDMISRAKLTNTFSKEFTIEIAAGMREGNFYKQGFSNNMKNKSEPVLTCCNKTHNWTKLSFKPDLGLFGMTHLEDDVVALMRKRVYDVAGCFTRKKTYPSVKVELNGTVIQVRPFSRYCGLYPVNKSRIVAEKLDPRWEVCVCLSEGQFQQVSFVNSIATIKGGTHVDYVTTQITNYIVDNLNEMNKDSSVQDAGIKNKLCVFVNCMIETPEFDSTIQRLTLDQSHFESEYKVSTNFLERVAKIFLSPPAPSRELEKSDGFKAMVEIEKLEDANLAGGDNSHKCTLILTIGDSTKTKVMAGLSGVSREYYGVLPLYGSILNVRKTNLTAQEFNNNKDIKNLMAVLGLKQCSKYNDVKSLRYGQIMFLMNHEDHDASHVKGLVINFIHCYWPELLRVPSFFTDFRTPVVKATHRNEKIEKFFYSMPEYEAWKAGPMGNASEWAIRQYTKGPGGTNEECKEYFSNPDLHKRFFVWEDEQKDGEAIRFAFSRKMSEARKEFLWNCEPRIHLDQKEKFVTFEDFVKKALSLHFMDANLRNIPSMCDGFKRCQRLILFWCLKRDLETVQKETSVNQLSHYILKHSDYHSSCHHNQIADQIIGMAQDYVGSNNINLLQPLGQFGTRNLGGNDAAHANEIYTKLSPVTRLLFRKEDDVFLEYVDQGMPNWYMPIIPTVLVNGCEGVGAGWNTFVPKYDPRVIVENIRRLIKGERELLPMNPWYKGFNGTIEKTVSEDGEFNYTTTGRYDEVDDGDDTIRITELPIGRCTHKYKKELDKNPLIESYKQCSDNTSVSLELKLSKKGIKMARRKGKQQGLLKTLKLISAISTSKMNLFDGNGVLKKYATPEEILKEFFELRLECYKKRKAIRLKNLKDELEKLNNRLRFVVGVGSGEIKFINKTKAQLVQELTWMNFKQFPEDFDGSCYDYLIRDIFPMPKVQELREESERVKKEIEALSNTKEETMWLRDLESLVVELDKLDWSDAQAEEEREAAQIEISTAKKAGESETPDSFNSRMDTEITEEDVELEIAPGKRRRTRSECKRGLAASEIQPVTAEVEAVDVLPKKKMRKMSPSPFINEEEESIETAARSSSSKDTGCGSASSRQYVEQYWEGAASAWTEDDVCERQEARPYNRQKLLVVVNRLPVSVVRRGEDSWSVEISDGGLIGALSGVEESDVRWIGWAGVNVLDEVGKKTLSKALAQKMCIPVFFDEENVRQDYDGYCNNILWPLFHFLGLPQEDRLARSFQSQFAAYKKANQTFAAVVNEHYEEGDVIWCHDYHLMFLPKFLKEHNIKMKVGWFLHTPFPSSKIYMRLPSRSELLRSVLAADLVGFHTNEYVRGFVSACTRIIGLVGAAEGVVDQGRVTRVADFPMGIDFKRFIQALEVPEVIQHMKELKEKFAGKKVMLGVDRLDMSKGIPQKFLAFERFLEENPNWRDKVVLLQIAVPTRTDDPEYQKLRSQVHETLGRIKSRFARLTEPTSPIHYLDHPLDFHALCAVYAVTDIALVTPLSDGMNLVSYEFVSCQQTKKGVLILSEFAGAAESLGGGAILVNPWNIADVAASIGQALIMSPEEREKRHGHNYHHVTTHSAQQWAESFVRELTEA